MPHSLSKISLIYCESVRHNVLLKSINDPPVDDPTLDDEPQELLELLNKSLYARDLRHGIGTEDVLQTEGRLSRVRDDARVTNNVFEIITPPFKPEIALQASAGDMKLTTPDLFVFDFEVVVIFVLRIFPNRENSS